MSLQWREEIAVMLAPTGALAARRGRGLAREFAAHAGVAAQAGVADPIAAAVATLAPALDAAGESARRVRVVLSDLWVRFTVVPGSGVRVDRTARDAQARYALMDTYGEALDEWTVTSADAPPGRPFLACAIPTRLIEAIRSTVAADRRRLLSMQPQSVVAYNAARSRLGEPGSWFATVDARSFQAFRNGPDGVDDHYAVHEHSDWLAELERLAARARWRGAEGDAPPRLYVDMPAALRAGVSAGRLGGYDWLDPQADDTADFEIRRLARLYE